MTLQFCCTGGIVTVYVGQPLDTIKVKMQTFPTLYGNAVQCFIKTFKQDGIARGLYAGTVPSLAANVSENAVLFCFYGMCQKIVSFVTGKTITYFVFRSEYLKHKGKIILK